MTTRELAGIVMETFGWLFVGGAGCLAWNEYVTLHSDEFLRGLMEDSTWKTIIILAVVGLALTIWGRKLRSKLSAAAFGVAGASFLLCYSVLAVSE